MIIKIRSRKFFELQAGLALLAIGLTGCLIVRFFPEMLSVIPPCMFRLWSGIPCPACGATSAGIHLIRWQWGQAIAASPLFTFLYAVMILIAANALLGLIWKKNFSVQLTQRQHQIIRRAMAAAVILNWIYLIVASQLK